MKTVKLFALVLTLFIGVNNLKSQTKFNDVANIFYKRCSSCHHEGGAGPFSLTNYKEIAAYSSSIKSAVNINKMPPWPVDTTYSRFVGEHIITPVEKDKIIKWVNDGSLEGDKSITPASPNYTKNSGPNAGKTPDLELAFPMLTSNATGDGNPYFCVSIPTGLTKNKILRSVEIERSNPGIIHHDNLFIDTLGGTVLDTTGGCFSLPANYIQVVEGIYSSGFKTGTVLKANYTFYIQTHFNLGSGGKSNQTKLKLYFYDDTDTVGIRFPRFATTLQNWGLNIPANTTRTFTAIWDTSKINSIGGIVAKPPAPKEGTTLLMVAPHSHSAGRDILIYAYKGKDTIKLIHINNWTEHFQYGYTFKKLLKIPNDYTVKTEHFYDNTANNPYLYKKDPLANIVAGPAQTDEMLYDSFLYFPYRAGDEHINIDSIISLALSVPAYESTLPNFKTFIYPNPGNDKVTIYVSNESVNKCSIINLLGVVVAETELFNEEIAVDVKNIPSGIYTVETIDTKTNSKTTNKLIVSH